MAELLQCMGIDSTGCTVPEMMSDIILALKKKETPLVVLDEADKLSDQVLYFFIRLYNKLEDRVGIILCATDYLEKRIKKGVRTNRKGYKEIYSRVGRKFIPIQVVNSEDVAAVCIANGVTDPGNNKRDYRRLRERFAPGKTQSPRGQTAFNLQINGVQMKAIDLVVKAKWYDYGSLRRKARGVPRD